MHGYLRIVAPAVALVLLAPRPAAAQPARQPLPLEPPRASGLAVSPVYEGWYRNPDGTFSLSFGYLNRNREEVVEVPIGPRNFIAGAEPPAGLPTRFLPRRHYGVFTVTVPASFGADDEVVWTVDIRGQTFAIPGRLNHLYEIDALGAPATGDTPPLLRFTPGGSGASGPHGVVGPPLEGRVGQPLDLAVWASDEEDERVTLRWTKWSGPGGVAFAEPTLRTEVGEPRAATTATFDAPGEYVLYVRANTSGLATAGHEQCCWTNGYLNVTVTR